MASIDSSTSSSQISALTCEEHKRTIDEASLNRMKGLVERLSSDNATLKKSLDTERSGLRALKAQHEATIRNLRTEFRKKEEFLEKQLRVIGNSGKTNDDPHNGSKAIELKKLAVEIQSLKAANKGLQEKLKVAQSAESARAAELRAQAARHTALEHAARKDARAQSHKLLEELKSKERLIIQLKREMARQNAHDHDQAQRMESKATELQRKLRVDQAKEKTDREDLKTDIQHRKETFYREAPPSDEDSAVSSAPPSLSPQPNNDMWSCALCRAAEERAEASARECARLTDALRDARDQLELMEFRLLELEDAGTDKGARENLTDTDSGCVSPGSRIKDSASPELKRMDSGYKSPHAPSSPCNPRRNLGIPSHDEFKEEFAKAQVLADILDRNSENSDSLRSSPIKDHLEQMILNSASSEDRSCLEQVLMLLYNYQALSSSVSEDEFQVKPKRICDLKNRNDIEIPTHKTHKAIATVTPYSQQSQKGYKCESLESLCSDERKPSCILQESGIFEEVETETRATQTEVNDFECTGELNTEIQRLNSIREKLERQGRNRSLVKEDGDGLECRCVKLGKKHKQYYERRLKFLEGKISIYEAAEDVKKAKLAERLQKEYILENRVQEIESQLSELQDKYERLEEECCELEEIENDTRLHWQQLEMDYELCTAQLRDMTEQRECSRGQVERLMTELTKLECAFQTRETELLDRLTQLYKVVPALILWNILRALRTSANQRAITYSMAESNKENKAQGFAIKIKRPLEVRDSPRDRQVLVYTCMLSPQEQALRQHVERLLKEKQEIERETAEVKKALEQRVSELEIQLEQSNKADGKYGPDMRIYNVHTQVKIAGTKGDKKGGDRKADEDELEFDMKPHKLHERIAELEKREVAYLEMLTQADDMWAEMEDGYKRRITESTTTENKLKEQVKNLTTEREHYKKCLEPLRKKIKEIEESESALRVNLDKAERDANSLMEEKVNLEQVLKKAHSENAKVENELRELQGKFRREVEQLRKINKKVNEDYTNQREAAKKHEKAMIGDLDLLRKELQRSYKNNQDLETTTAELKEEVESLEKQLALTQKALSQCKRKCDDKIKTLSHELSIKTEELEEMRSESMRQSLHTSRIDLKPDRTEYIDEGYTICTAVPKKVDYGRMHHSMGYITSETRCSCPSMRSHLVGQLIEDLFDRIHNTVDEDLTRLCKEIVPSNAKADITVDTKAKITNYLLMAISKELVRSIGDADAKTDTEEWQRAVSSMTYTVPNFTSSDSRGDFASLRLEGNAGVLNGASRLASVSCACAAARLCAAVPELADCVKVCQEEVLDHSDVKIMEEQLANAIESIVNCPSCALGTNAIVWSTDV